MIDIPGQSTGTEGMQSDGHELMISYPGTILATDVTGANGLLPTEQHYTGDITDYFMSTVNYGPPMNHYITSNGYWADDGELIGTRDRLYVTYYDNGEISIPAASSYTANADTEFARPYNPRASRVNNEGGTFAERWKIRIYGPIWGLLAQYDPEDWDTMFPGNTFYVYGPYDAYLATVEPSSYQAIDISVGQFIEYSPTSPPGTLGWISIAAFWPGKVSTDFPWG